MMSASPHDVPAGLLEHLLDGPVLRPERIAAGRRRAAAGPPDPDHLAAAVVAECWPVLLRA